MLRDRIYEYYINQDFNCAEALLLAADAEYDLNIPDESFKLVGGFGAGMGCGHTCGALCSGVAVIGQKFITLQAHKSADLKDLCTRFVLEFNAAVGSENCEEIKVKYKKDDVRCLEAVCIAADVLENLIAHVESRK